MSCCDLLKLFEEKGTHGRTAAVWDSLENNKKTTPKGRAILPTRLLDVNVQIDSFLSMPERLSPKLSVSKMNCLTTVSSPRIQTESPNTIRCAKNGCPVDGSVPSDTLMSKNEQQPHPTLEYPLLYHALKRFWPPAMENICSLYVTILFGAMSHSVEVYFESVYI